MFAAKRKILDKIQSIEIIRDYETLYTNILKQIDNHTPISERYIIMKTRYTQEIIQILEG